VTVVGVTLTVEVAFTATPFATSPTWTDVSAWVKKVSTKRGRNNEVGQVEAGTATVLLDNADGRFSPRRASSPSPYAGNIVPRRQVRISAADGATTHRLFTGYTERWSITHPGGGDYAESQLECVDAFKILSTTKLQDFYGEQVRELDPVAYYPLSEPAGSVWFGDQSGRGLPAGVLVHRTANDQTSAGGDSLTPASSTTSVHFDPDGASGGADIDLGGALAATRFRTDNWSLSFWFKLGADFYPGGRANPPSPGTTDPTPPAPTAPDAPLGPIVTDNGNGTGTAGWSPGGVGGGTIDGFRVNDGAGNPIWSGAGTPDGMGGFTSPPFPIAAGACNDITVQAHTAAGWSAPSAPSPCLTNPGASKVYDNFQRADTPDSEGPGTATDGVAWSDQAVSGLQVHQNEARASRDGLGGNLLDVGSADQDFVAWVRGTDAVGAPDDYNILFRATNQANHYFLDCPPMGSAGATSLIAMGTTWDRMVTVTSNNYPLSSYCGWHVQISDTGGIPDILVARDGQILFSILDPAPTPSHTIVTAGQKVGLRLQGALMRCNLIDQGNPAKPRHVRAYPLAGGLSFTCQPPQENPHPGMYRVKVGGQTVESATLPVVVTGLTDFSDYSWTMSAQKPGTGWGGSSEPGKGWGPDSDIGHGTPGWAAAPTIGTATSIGGGNVSLTYTLGAANSVDYSSTMYPIKAVASTRETFSFNTHPYPNPLVLPGLSIGYGRTIRFRVYVCGEFDNQRGCDTMSAWSNEVNV
jgi:hypothetical protein